MTTISMYTWYVSFSSEECCVNVPDKGHNIHEQNSVLQQEDWKFTFLHNDDIQFCRCWGGGMWHWHVHITIQDLPSVVHSSCWCTVQGPKLPSSIIEQPKKCCVVYSTSRMNCAPIYTYTVIFHRLRQANSSAMSPQRCPIYISFIACMTLYKSVSCTWREETCIQYIYSSLIVYMTWHHNTYVKYGNMCTIPPDGQQYKRRWRDREEWRWVGQAPLS